jgi:hypothetical protein
LESTDNSSGRRIFNVFKKILEQYNINWKKYLYPQFYDDATSMQGQYKGLKTLIQNENEKALYV